MTERADVIVVGLGPGGEDAAGRLGQSGLDVLAIEAELVGGECPYWGCVPSKMAIRAADLLAEARRVEGMAGGATVRPDWSVVAMRIREEATDDWDDAVAARRLEDKGVRLVRGWGRLDGPGRVVVDGVAYEATRGVVVNVGARAWSPPIDGLSATPFWNNRDALEATEVPTTLAVLGGGTIGVELAQAYARFGAQVTVLEVGPRLVGPEEPEATALLEEVLRREGLDVRTGVQVDAIGHNGQRFEVRLGAGEPVDAERLLVATGRRPDLASLGVATLGLDEHAHALEVDERCRVVGAERTWALGDVTGRGAFTHVSMYQADIVVQDVLRRAVVPADYRALPRVTFTDPELGAVGLTESEARAKGISVRTGSAPLAASARGWIHKAGNDGLIKLVEDVDRGVLVGATSMGPWGGEVLGLLSLAVHAEVPTTTLRHMIYAYPTFHRAIEAAVKDLLGEAEREDAPTN